MRRALGKGLAALIPTIPTSETAAPVQAQEAVPPGPVKIPIESIRANRYQPRKVFDQAKLEELSESIKEHGLAQPLIVCKDGKAGGYELIAGERRLRACQLAGLREVEVIIRSDQNDRKMLSLAMVENLQREDLNAIEAALGYLRLMKEFQISQTDLTKVVGKSKSAISNTLRLLDLPDNIQKAIHEGVITEGHARALLMVDEEQERQFIFKKIVDGKLSVRDSEDLARGNNDGARAPRGKKSVVKSKSADIASIETALEHRLGTKVVIRLKKESTNGIISLHFYNLNDFDRLIGVLKK